MQGSFLTPTGEAIAMPEGQDDVISVSQILLASGTDSLDHESEARLFVFSVL